MKKILLIAIIATIVSCQPMYEITVQCEHEYQNPWYGNNPMIDPFPVIDPFELEENQPYWNGDKDNPVFIGEAPNDDQVLIYEANELKWVDSEYPNEDTKPLSETYPYPPFDKN